MKRIVVLAIVIAFAAGLNAKVIEPPLEERPAEYKKLKDLFSTLDMGILRCGNEKKISEYLKGKNREIVNYLKEKLPQYGPYDEVDVNEPAATWLGLVYAIGEESNWQPINQLAKAALPQWLTCTLGVI